MAWTKVSTTTKQWRNEGGSADVLTDNAYSVDGTSVLQEYLTFLGTRGWVGSSSPIITAQGNYDSYDYQITKTAVCEDGSSVTWGFVIRYLQFPDSSDVVRMYPWDNSTGAYGTIALWNQDLSSTGSFAGKWSFWVSDEDSDSFAIIPGEGGSVRCIGFWPHSGDLFAQGYWSTDFPNASGIKPLFPDSASWEGFLGTGSSSLDNRLAGSGASDGMNPQAFKLDYAWLCNNYDRPIFYSFGGDMHSYCSPDAASDTVFSTLDAQYVNAMKVGSNYYIAIGQHQKILLDCGTVPPIF